MHGLVEVVGDGDVGGVEKERWVAGSRPAGSAAGDDAPDARARSSHMTIRHLGMIPSIHPDAYVAPAAVVSGQVSIGAGSCIMLAGSWPPGAARFRSVPAA